MIDAPEPLAAIDDIDSAIRHALDNPIDAGAAAGHSLFPGMKLTIAFDDVSLPLPKTRRPDIRQRVIEAAPTRAAEAGVDDVHLIAALALHRRMTESELRHAVGDRVYDAFEPLGQLYPVRRRGPLRRAGARRCLGMPPAPGAAGSRSAGSARSRRLAGSGLPSSGLSGRRRSWARRSPRPRYADRSAAAHSDRCPDQPALVVATPGAEPPADGGYAGAVLLDTGLLLLRPELRAAEEALRRWLNVLALARSAATADR